MADPESEMPDAVSRLVDDQSYPPSRHLELIYNEVKGRLDLQRSELDGLQRIVAIVLTAAGVVLGFAGSQFPAPSVHGAKFGLFVAAVVALAFDVVARIMAIWPRRVQTVGDPGELVDGYTAAPTNVMLYDLIGAGRAAFDRNAEDGFLAARSWLVRAQLCLLEGGALLLGAGILSAGEGPAVKPREQLPSSGQDGARKSEWGRGAPPGRRARRLLLPPLQVGP